MTNERILTLQARTNVAELKRVNYRMFFRSWAGFIFTGLVVLGIAAAVAIWLGTKSVIASIAVLLVWSAYVVRMYGKPFGSMNSRIERLSLQSEPITYEVSGDGISRLTPSAPIHLAWQSISQAIELPEGYVLYCRPRPLYISKSWSANDIERNQFIEIMRAHLMSRAQLTQ